MSDENNKRYVGEVYIDGKSDVLLQRFLRNLFDAYNGKDKGFIADMLDDWHLDDILEYVNSQDATKLDTITIGQSIFTVLDPSKFLQVSDIIYNNFKCTKDENNDYGGNDWLQFLYLRNKSIDEDENSTESKAREDSTGFSDENYLLNDILLDIYYTLDLKKTDLTLHNALDKAHKDLEKLHNDLRIEYDEFRDKFTGVLQTVLMFDENGDPILDENGNQKTTTFLNAQLINGFQIIPITQEKYDALSSSAKEYWRNIYIIRDNIPTDYTSPVQFDLLKHVHFEFNEEENCIYYYNGVSDEPLYLCSLEDLLRGANFNQVIYDYVTGTQDVIYNLDAVKKTLKALVLNNPNEYNNYPFLTREEAHGLITDITSESGTITSELDEDGFQVYDITNAFNTTFDDIYSKKENVANRVTAISNESTHNQYPTAKAVYTIVDNKTNTDSDLQRTFSSALNNLRSDLTGRIEEMFRDLSTAINQQGETLQNNIDLVANLYYDNSLTVNIYRTNDSENNVSNSKQLLSITRGYHKIYARVFCDDPQYSVSNRNVIIFLHGAIYELETNSEGKTRNLTISEDFPTGYHQVFAYVRGETDHGTANSTDSIGQVRSASSSKILYVT